MKKKTGVDGLMVTFIERLQQYVAGKKGKCLCSSASKSDVLYFLLSFFKLVFERIKGMKNKTDGNIR